MGLRSFALYRDLGGVADVIDIAFADDEGEFGARARDEFRSLKKIAPVIWFLGLFLPRLRDSFSGFVWEEGGRIVGNASVYRSQEDDSRWLIGNVSVLPEFRHRGIAKRLTEEAIKYARRRKGKLVVLDVRADNPIALHLYQELGMTQFDSVIELILRSGSAVSTGLFVDELRAVSPEEWFQVYELAKVAVPEEVQKVVPVRERDYRPTTMEMLAQATMAAVGQETRAYAIDRNGRFDAYLKFEPNRASPFHKLSILVRPEARGKYEDLLAKKAVYLAREYRQFDVMAEIRTQEKEQIAALKEHGFLEIRQLLRLGLKL